MPLAGAASLPLPSKSKVVRSHAPFLTNTHAISASRSSRKTRDPITHHPRPTFDTLQLLQLSELKLRLLP